MNYTQELAFAKEMARDAATIMKKYYEQDREIVQKSDNSPVTAADKEINSLLIKKTQATFPEYGVLGEEESWQENRNILWVCDPIDGTVPYIIHVPTSVFSLALVVEGVPLVAVVYNPWTDELYEAAKGTGALRNGAPIHVSRQAWGPGIHISAPMHITDPKMTQEKAAQLATEKIFINNIPGLVHGCMTVAEGAIEARLFYYNTPHDIAAAKLIVEEAGGKVTDLDGNEQRYDRPINGALVTNGIVHEKIVELVKQ